MKICLHQRNYLARHCFRVLSECGEQLACSREQYGPALRDPAHDLACVSAILDKIGWELELASEQYAPVVIGADDPIMPLAQVQAWARRFVGVDEVMVGTNQRRLEVADLEREHEDHPHDEEPEINVRLAHARMSVGVGQSLLVGKAVALAA